LLTSIENKHPVTENKFVDDNRIHLALCTLDCW